jgi:gliding motility-associated-like protein
VKNKIWFLVTVFSLLFQFKTNKLNAQISIVPNQAAIDLAQMMAGAGVTVSNAYFNATCDSAIQAGKFFVTASNLGMDSGIILTSGDASLAAGPCGSPAFSANSTGDPDLDTLLTINNVTSRDACVLEFDFIPTGDSIKFNYVFGSSEYSGYTCSNFTDAFGFFISGPGITGIYSNNSANIALLPSGCPVAINTVNGSTANPCGAVTTPCAPPNNALFFNNLPFGNTATGVAYNGYTLLLTAEAAVVPCSTYHFKLAIGDASDQTLDSGVFLEAGSLSSNSIVFTPVSILNEPEPYLIEGCASGGLVISRPIAQPYPFPVNYTLGGTATNGVDYALLSGSAIIPAGQTSVSVPIIPLTDAIIDGGETVIIYKQANCSTNITDTVTFIIYDSIRLNISTTDTAVCAGASVNIVTIGDSSLNYSWTPISGNINNDTIQNPTVNPVSTTTFIVTADLPNSGCATVSDALVVSIIPGPTVNIGPDFTICENMSYNFTSTVTPTQPYNYLWTPATFLSNPTLPNPVGNFITAGTYTYVLTVTSTAAQCAGTDTLIATILPDDFDILNNDTTICEGSTVNVLVNGHPAYTYNWNPITYVSNANSMNTAITPPFSSYYNLTATYPGCPPINHGIQINVEPKPIVNLGADREKCYFDTLRFEPIILPDTFNNYNYTWLPAAGLNASNIKDVVFNGTANSTFTLVVNTPKGCTGQDNIAIIVHPAEFAEVKPTDTSLCPGATIPLRATGASKYLWTPGIYTTDSLSANTTGTPIVSTIYTLYAYDAFGCVDTDMANIYIAPNAIINTEDNIVIFPGESVELFAGGNCSYYNWQPPTFLNNNTLKNPIVSGLEVSTKYTVIGTTEFGCIDVDSITVTIKDESVFVLPNAFTPGSGNGLNDILKIQVRGTVSLNYFRIFNRWGELVFETNDLNKGWDGTYNGKMQPIGAYVYDISGKNNKGKTIQKTGNITLIR